MKIGILTFHFAHNYGAVLQAYALKRTLEKESHDVEMVNFQPQKTIGLYSLNPFVYGFHPKAMIKKILSWSYRYKQSKLFSEFTTKNFEQNHKRFSDTKTLESELLKYSVLIYGSDQIWNLEITGKEPVYYGKYAPHKCKKIVYAGSFGKDYLTIEQKEYVRTYLSGFQNVSVREGISVQMLDECGIKSRHVCDPVFLIDIDDWNELAMQSEIDVREPYILFYALRTDLEFEKKIMELAEIKKLKILSIHPIGNRMNIGKQLYNVGPLEFLKLIKNAEYVCTNSFHATSFSVIFKKRLMHEAYEKKNGRVQSLFDSINAESVKKSICDLEWFDFSTISDEKLNGLLLESKEFILNALKN